MFLTISSSQTTRPDNHQHAPRSRSLISHALEVLARQHALTDGRRFDPVGSTLVQPSKDEDTTCQDCHLPPTTHTHTLLDALHLKLHLLATHTREHHHTPSYLSEAERLQSHTMLFARNSLVCKHTGYQYTENESALLPAYTDSSFCHARKVTVKRHGFRLYLGTEH